MTTAPATSRPAAKKKTLRVSKVVATKAAFKRGKENKGNVHRKVGGPKKVVSRF